MENALSNIVHEDSQPRNLIDLKEKVTTAVDKINMHRRQVSLGLYTSFRKRLTTLLKTGGNRYK